VRLRLKCGGRAAGGELSASGEGLTWPEYVEELKTLGLFNSCFDPELYAERLSRRIGVEIRLQRLEEVGNPLILKKLAEERIAAGLFVRPEPRPVAWIVYAESSSPAEELLSQYHELGHLAQGDPVYPGRLLARGKPERADGPPWRAPNPLSPTPPASLREARAEVRAEYSMVAGLYGALMYARFGWSLDKYPDLLEVTQRRS
jgi:hypothetical protein